MDYFNLWLESEKLKDWMAANEKGDTETYKSFNRNVVNLIELYSKGIDPFEELTKQKQGRPSSNFDIEKRLFIWAFARRNSINKANEEFFNAGDHRKTIRQVIEQLANDFGLTYTVLMEQDSIDLPYDEHFCPLYRTNGIEDSCKNLYQEYISSKNN